jgi:hypothetical protein
MKCQIIEKSGAFYTIEEGQDSIHGADAVIHLIRETPDLAASLCSKVLKETRNEEPSENSLSLPI